MPRLSLVVITLNEESSISRCLNSARIADEVIVVDGGSTDRTTEIAKACGARVIVASDWRGFGFQKNRALDAATGDWVLSLDADEWLDPALAVEINETISSADGVDGYFIARRSRFKGIVVKHSGWWPDYLIRLFRAKRGRFSESRVHERVIVEGVTKYLRNPIEHRGVVDDADAEDKIQRYALAAAAEMAENGRKANLLSAPLHGTGAFLKTYVIKQGYLDSRIGLRIAQNNARYSYRKWRLLHANGRTGGRWS